MPMRTHAIWLALGGLLVLACGEEKASNGNTNTERTGGTGGSRTGGSAGATATGGSGGGTTAGGSGGTSTTTGGAGGGSGGAAGGTGGGGGTGVEGGVRDASDASADGPADGGGDAGPPSSAGPVPYGCTNCKPIFDGKSLEGWETRDPTNWLAKDGVLASQGKVAPIWTKADYGDYRIFFKVRQVKGNHKPDVIFFGKRPGPNAGQSGALGGAQLQPPNGGSWDYGAGGTFTRDMNPNWNANLWHQCEVLVKEAGSFRAACCPLEPAAACKLVLTWKGTGRKHPWAIQMHNPGLFDEYKDIYVEENPALDELLCLKK